MTSCCETLGLDSAQCASGLARLGQATFDAAVCNSTIVHTNKATPSGLRFRVSGLDMKQKVQAELAHDRWSGGSELRRMHATYLATKCITILDIGANLGIFAVFAYKLLSKRFHCLRVLSIEPLPETHFFLRANLRGNNVLESSSEELRSSASSSAGVVHSSSARASPWSGVRALNLALTSDGREVNFAVGTRSMTAHETSTRVARKTLQWDAIGGVGDARRNDHTSRGTHRVGGGGVGAVPSPDGFRHYSVASTTLEGLLDDHNVSSVDLMKLDCEGCEYEMLRELRAKPLLAQRIASVAGEVP